MRPVLFAWNALQTAATEWLNDYCPRHAAALSYYTVFSLAPLLVILVGVVGIVFGEGTAHAQLVAEARHLAGAQAGDLIDALLKAAAKPAEGTLASAMAFVLLLVGATGVLVELREALDRIWGSPTPRRADEHWYEQIWRLVRTRLLTFSILFAIGFIMLVSLAVSAYLQSLDQWVSSHLSDQVELARWLNSLVSFVILSLLIGLLMMGLPTRRPSWRMVVPAALLTTLLFSVGKAVIGLYLGSTSTTSVYGAAGSLVAVMAWVYYSALIFLFSAELAWVVYTTPRGEMPGSLAHRRVLVSDVAT